MSETLAAGDIYMLRGSSQLDKEATDEYCILIERRSVNAWWMLNLDTGKRVWDSDASLLNTKYYRRIV